MKLTCLVFLGSARDSTPPRPARLGLRVARRVEALLGEKANVRLVDPLDYDLSGAFKPHFAYAKGAAPRALDDLAKEIAAADAYVMVSPEYNHSMSPALAISSIISAPRSSPASRAPSSPIRPGSGVARAPPSPCAPSSPRWAACRSPR
jgi:hypothetical protein